MQSLNKVEIIGNLGKDPETRYMPNGDAVTNITVATTDTWKDKNGEKVEKTEWHRITFYRKLGEIAGEHLKKGSRVYLEGKLVTRQWTDKAGIERYTTEIVSDKLIFLDKATGDNNDAKPAKERKQAPAPTGTGFDDMDDDDTPPF